MNSFIMRKERFLVNGSIVVEGKIENHGIKLEWLRT